MARGRKRRSRHGDSADGNFIAPSSTNVKSGRQEDDEEDVEQAEQETVASRVRAIRPDRYEGYKALLYDGTLIAYDAGGSCDPEVGYQLAESLVTVYGPEDGESGEAAESIRFDVCPYFNEEISTRSGCLWMPLGMARSCLTAQMKWTEVKAVTGLKGDRARTTWAEHKRIQKVLGVEGTVRVRADQGDEDEQSAGSEDDDDSSAAGSPAAASSASSARAPVSQRSRKKSSVAASAAAGGDGSDDDGDGDGADSDGDQPPAKRSRGGRRASSGSSPAKARQPRTPKAAKVPKLKKGFVAERPEVELFDKDPVFYGNDPVRGGDTVHALDIIRAVYTRDIPLLKKLLADRENVNTTSYGRSPADTDDAFQIAAKRSDVEILTVFQKHFTETRDKRLEQRVAEPRPTLQQIQSGSVGIATFGHAVGAIGAARGGRELHNALLAQHAVGYDSFQAVKFMDNALANFEDTEKYDRLVALTGLTHQFKMYVAARSGNLVLARHLAKKMKAADGWGLNQLHVTALSSDGTKFEAFREVSVTKKSNMEDREITPVHLSAINPDPQYLKALLDVHPDCTVSDADQWRIAHYAAACAGDGPLSVLVERSTDMFGVSKDKMTPLLVAAKLGRTANVKLILSDQANVRLQLKLKDKEGNSALHLAAKHGHVDAVGAIIDAGMKETPCNSAGLTPMGLAAAFGWLDVIKKMKEKGFSIVKPDRRQRSPLILACRDGQLHVVHYLLHHGADANCADSSGNSAVHYAAGYGWLRILKALVELGDADADSVSSWKGTPLSCAALKHHSPCVEYLVHLPNINLNVVDERGRTIAANLCRHPTYPGLRQLKLLIERGADISLADADGMTPLHHMAACHSVVPHDGRKELTKQYGACLIGAGANVEQAAKNGSTPLLCALHDEHNAGFINLEAASYLVSHGVSITAVDKQGRNPLHHATQHLESEEAASLITALLRHADAGKLVNTYDSSGATPLLAATQRMITALKGYFWGNVEQQKREKRLQYEKSILAMLKSDGVDVSLPLRKTQVVTESGDEPMDTSEEDPESDFSDDEDDEEYEDEAPQQSNVTSFELVDEEDDVMFHDDLSTQRGYSIVHIAAEQADLVAILTAVLKKPGVQINKKGVGGRTALHLAVAKDNQAATEKLLKANADVNIQTVDGESVLHLMTPAHKRSKSFKTILQASDLTLQDRRGRTVLHLAAIAGDMDLAKSFLAAGCPLNATDRLGRTAFHYAVAEGAARADASSDFEAMLIKAGADVNTRDEFGRTAVHYAFLPALYVEPNRDTLEKRLAAVPLDKVMEETEKKVDASSRKYDPIETVYCLFSVGKGTLVDPVDKKGRSPLHYAARASALTCSLHLLSAGADINLKDGEQGDMPLRMALCYKNPEYAVMMMQKGAETTPGVLTKSKDVFDFRVVLKSVFYIAVEQGWLGVAYMIFDSDFPLFDGLRDAMLTRKYKLTTTLMKKADDTKLAAVDEERRSLLHWLAISSDPSVDDSIKDAVSLLLDAGVDVNSTDTYGRTALHYAAQRACHELVQILAMNRNSNPDIKDVDGKPALALAMQGNRRYSASQKRCLEEAEGGVAKLLDRQHFCVEIPVTAPVWEHVALTVSNLIDAKANADFSYSDPAYSGGTTTPLCHAVRQGHKEAAQLLLGKRTADQKKELCHVCDQLGRSALSHAIVQNESDIASALLPHSDVNWKDAEGRSLVHLVVKPLKYGSYENVELLRKLNKAKAPLDDDDKDGKAPMYYAKLQDSGIMAAELLKLGAAGPMPGLKRDRTVWKKFADREFSVDEDCLAYIGEVATKEKVKPQPDKHFEKRTTSAVYGDKNDVMYDVTLNKVEVGHGAYGMNLYYRMQVVHESVQDAYYLWTHWGRWGDDTGMFQRTPFNTAEEACKEFCKIFRSKTGNDFLQAAAGIFAKQPKKYALLPSDRSHRLVSSLLIPIDLDASPSSAMSATLQSTLKYLMDMTVLRDRAQVHGLDVDSAEKVLMFGEASSETMYQAKSVLAEMLPLVKAYQQLRYNPGSDIDKLVEANDRIVKLSQKYYEIVPFAHTAFSGSGSSPLVIMFEEHNLKEAMTQLEKLTDVSTTARLLLAAWYRRKTLSPLDYVYKALDASMVPLGPDMLERQVIESYMMATAEKKQFETLELSALYKVERRGEPEAMEKFRSLPNHRLLWHGSPKVNILAILNQGLMLKRGDPLNRGFGGYGTEEDEENIWNGIYFADMFAKSYHYTQDSLSYRDQFGRKDNKERLYMLLCEVALGNMQSYDGNRHTAKLPASKDSLHCPGRKGPNWSNAIVLPNGVEIPLGEVCHLGRDIDAEVETNRVCWPMGEYIVANRSRIRIRYVLELQPKKKEQ